MEKWKMWCTVLSIALCMSAEAQEKNEKSKIIYYGGFGHGSFTTQMINIRSMNEQLKSNGYSEISPYQMSAGGGGNFVLHNFILGGEGAGLISSSVSGPSSSMGISGGYGRFHFGYLFSAGKRAVVYPALGIGGGGMTFIVQQKNFSSTFDSQIADPGGAAKFDAGGFILNAQLAWQYVICGHEKEGFLLGIKAGYNYSPLEWKITSEGQTVGSAPEMNFNGFYATIILGGGSIITK